MTDRAMIRVWDPFVRIFHWSQAALIGVAWLAADALKPLHEWAGYAIGVLIGLRIIWGFVGPRHARFADFVRGPRVVTAYLRDMAKGHEARHLGHNPAGGAMVVALLVVTAATVLTGWLQTTDAFWGSQRMEDIHETLATMILILVALHVGGVILASLRHHENLARAMLTGRKRAGPDP